MRRSSRKGIKLSKARARRDVLSDMAPTRILQIKLPPIGEPEVPKNKIKKAFDALDPSQRLALALSKGKKQTRKPFSDLSPLRRHICWMRLSDESILQGIVARKNGSIVPWMNNLGGNIHVRNNKLYFREDGKDFQFALKSEKRVAVKQSYFDPGKPATIYPITLYLRETYCNITKNEVTRILKTLESYQLMFPRYQHPKIVNSTRFTKPGIVAADTFFTSVKQGWKPMNCLCCMDVFSRWCRVYALERKEKKYFRVAIESFCKELLSMSIMPRRFLSDKGSELKVAVEIFEKFRLKRDGKQSMCLFSYTGQPVNVIENLNAQVQRRLEIFLISGITDEPNSLLFDISEQINNQPRKRKKNYTPNQLIRMPPAMRKSLNDSLAEDYSSVSTVPQEKLGPLKRNDKVRKLLMTLKEQRTNKLKGFQAKWSKRVYSVLFITSLRRNTSIKRYTISEPKGRTYYRHELLKIDEFVDREVLKIDGSTNLEVLDFYSPQET